MNNAQNNSTAASINVFGIVAAACAGTNLCAYSQVGRVCFHYSSMQWVDVEAIENQAGQGYVLFVISIFILANAALFVFFLLNGDKADQLTSRNVPVRHLHLLFTVVALVLYFIAAIVESWYASGYDIPDQTMERIDPHFSTWIVAAFFVWLNTILYIISAILIFLQLLRARRAAKEQTDDDTTVKSTVASRTPVGGTSV